MVRAGASFDVVGRRGSGRSTFLRHLQSRLVEDGWNVVEVTGIASLRQHALGALQMAGFGKSPAPLPTMADRVTEALSAKSVLLVDGWDDLDESSWGVLGTVGRRSEVPVVASRLHGDDARVTPTGVVTSTLGSSFRVEMPPLRIDEVATVLEEVLGGPASPDLTGRIFARSGGNVGLVVALAQAGRREQRIVRQGGTWNRARELYSSSLQGLIGSHLSELSMEERDVLETLTLVGTVKLSLARRVADWGVIEGLERRGFVRVFGFPDAQVMVHPPLLLEYFHHEPCGLRRARLTELVLNRLGSHAEDLPPLETVSSSPIAEDAVVLVNVFGDHARRRRAVAETMWRENPCAATATPYLQALLDVRASSTEIEAVLAETPTLASPASADLAEVTYTVARANWYAFHGGDLDRAVALLQEVASGDSPFARLADAELVQLMTFFGRVPEDAETRLAIDDGLPEEVKRTISEVRTVLSLAHGDFDSLAEFDAYTLEIEPQSLGFTGKILRALFDLFDGNFDEAMSFAYREYLQAVEDLDPDAARGFAWVYTVGLIFQGNYAKVDSILASVLAIGDTPVRGIYLLGLLNCGVVAAVHSGRPDLARRYVDEMDRISTPNGILLGQHRSWGRAQLLMYEGQVAAGSQLLREAADELWDRGGRFAAVMAYLIAQEVYPRPELYEHDMARARQIQGRLIGVQVDFVEAVVARDAEGLLGLTDELVSAGIPGMALSAFEQVAEWASAAGDQAVVAAMEARFDALRRRLPEGVGDTVRFRLTKVALSNREREFIEQIATGASNKEIAQALSVSVRTVESAVSRLARKLNVDGRRGIITWATAHSERE